VTVPIETIRSEVAEAPAVEPEPGMEPRSEPEVVAAVPIEEPVEPQIRAAIHGYRTAFELGDIEPHLACLSSNPSGNPNQRRG